MRDLPFLYKEYLRNVEKESINMDFTAQLKMYLEGRLEKYSGSIPKRENIII
jgi:hypothetical protein